MEDGNKCDACQSRLGVSGASLCLVGLCCTACKRVVCKGDLAFLKGMPCHLLSSRAVLQLPAILLSKELV